MTDTSKHNDDILAEAVEAMGHPPADTAAARRVWQRLQAEIPAQAPAREITVIHGCADFQALLPAYRSGRLAPARQALVEDHLRECVDCRRASAAGSGQAGRAPAREGRSPSHASRWVRWGTVAAAALLCLGLYQLGVLDTLLLSDGNARAVVQALDGRLMRLGPDGTTALAAGAELDSREIVRLGRGSRALFKLADGSRVEAGEHTELSLAPRRDGAAIELNRGRIIVQAARQQPGRHLYVHTADCDVSVKGTVFSVLAGLKGSRVAVLEGEVWVDHGRQTTKLQPGEQVSTHASLGPANLAAEVAWSQDSAHYRSLLETIKAAAGETLHQLTAVPLRYESELLPLVPESTVVLASLPNVGQELADAAAMFQERLEANPELWQWWQQQRGNASGEVAPEEAIEWIRQFGANIGDEVLLAFGGDHETSEHCLLLAAAAHPAELRRQIEELAARVPGSGTPEPAVILVDDPAAASPGPASALYVMVSADRLAASTALEELSRFQERVAQGGGGFPAGDFGRQVVAAYQDGVGWLIAADLEHIRPELTEVKAGLAKGGDKTALGTFEPRHLIVEQKTVREQGQFRVNLSHAPGAPGALSWLGAPAPMGALEYVSPDAYAVAGLLTADPAVMLDDVIGMISSSDQPALEQLQEWQNRVGLDLRRDLAEPLGGEFLFALDGPVLPVPSWKVVLRVDDPGRFEPSLEALWQELDRMAVAEGKPGLVRTAEEIGGVRYWHVRTADEAFAVTYRYHDGYFLLAPSQALLDAAVQTRESGLCLPASQTFQALLPVDGQADYSAFLYQNVQPLLGPLADAVPQAKSGQPGQKPALTEAIGHLPPMLLCLAAGPDRVMVTGTGLTDLDPFNLDFTRLPSLFGAAQLKRK